MSSILAFHETSPVATGTGVVVADMAGVTAGVCALGAVAQAQKRKRVG